MDGGLSASIALIFGVAKFCLELSEVSEESLVFCRLIKRVYIDLQETIRLLGSPAVQTYLAANPEDDAYVLGTIDSTKTALAGIGKFVEAVRLDASRNGSISLANRANWVLTHQSKLTSRQGELDACHKSLLQAMSRLQTWRDRPSLPTYEATVGGPDGQDYSAEAFLSPYKRRKARQISRKSSLVSVEDDVNAVSLDGNLSSPPLSSGPPPHQTRSPSLEENSLQQIDVGAVEPLSHQASPVPATLDVAALQSHSKSAYAKQHENPEDPPAYTYSPPSTSVPLPPNSTSNVELLRPADSDATAQKGYANSHFSQPSVSSLSAGLAFTSQSSVAGSLVSLTSLDDAIKAVDTSRPRAASAVELETISRFSIPAPDGSRPGPYGAVELESNPPRELNPRHGVYGPVELPSNNPSQLSLPIPLNHEDIYQTQHGATQRQSGKYSKFAEGDDETAPEVVIERSLPEVVTESSLPEVVTESSLPEVVTESSLPEVVTESTLPAQPMPDKFSITDSTQQSLPIDIKGAARSSAQEDRRRRRARLQLISGSP